MSRRPVVMLIRKDYLHYKTSSKILALICVNVLFIALRSEYQIPGLYSNDLLLINNLFDKRFFWNERIRLYSNYLILQTFSVTFS